METESTVLQKAVEEDVRAIYARGEPCQLDRETHCAWLHQRVSPCASPLSSGYVSLDASRAWLLYWNAHAYTLLNDALPEGTSEAMIETLKTFWHPQLGGFGGGSGQTPHLAATYASTLTMAILASPEAYAVVDRDLLYRFLLRMKQPDGSFTMCENGEIDVRGTYCALTAALLCNILTPELTRGCAAFIAKCQTYEGGFGARPGEEAHGGYSFCALAALCILDGVGSIDVDALLFWATHRQMAFEGGFQGRPHKLVDGCYSFWQGGLFPILKALGKTPSLCFDTAALRQYILLACQDPPRGGLRDKPGKRADYYHTCYCLSGLASLTPHDVKVTKLPEKTARFGLPEEPIQLSNEDGLPLTHPVVNVRLDKYASMMAHFYEESSL